MKTQSKLTKRQTLTKTLTNTVKNDGEVTTEQLTVNIRYDDECGNGHNTFSITGTLKEYTKTGKKIGGSGGCIHEDIVRLMPELEYLIKWHLCSSDGPLHYLANTLYCAGNRDCNGMVKGQPYRFERELMFNDVPFLYKPSKELLAFIDEVGLDYPWADAELIEIPHVKGPEYLRSKWTLAAMPVNEWYKCPFNDRDEAASFIHAMTHCKVEIIKRATAYGEGKEREFDSARRVAIWPEATDEQLSLPKDELAALLTARLPALIEDFRKDMEGLGFTF